MIRRPLRRKLLISWSDGTNGQQSTTCNRWRWFTSAIRLVSMSSTSLRRRGLLPPDDGRARKHLLAARGGCDVVPLSSTLYVLPPFLARPVAAELQLAGGAVVVGRRAGTPPLLVQMTGTLAQQPSSKPRSPDDVPRPVGPSLYDPLHRDVTSARPGVRAARVRCLALRGRRRRCSDVT